MAIEAKRQELVEATERLPAQSHGAKLARSASVGLDQLEAIICEPLDPDDVKQRRLVGDMALAVNKLFFQAAAQAYQARRDDDLARLIQLIAEESAKP